MSKNGNTYFDRSVIGPGGEAEGRTEMSQNPRQSKSIRAQLLTAMQVGEYAHCDRLPRESVLSEMLGISRTQLRDILASLDREADDKADSKVAAQLGIPTGTPILRISRLCTADGRPAIYCEDVVEKAKLQRPYTAEELRQPIFDFLQNVCGISSYLDLTDLRPVAEHGRGGLRY